MLFVGLIPALGTYKCPQAGSTMLLFLTNPQRLSEGQQYGQKRDPGCCKVTGTLFPTGLTGAQEGDCRELPSGWEGALPREGMTLHPDPPPEEAG